MSLLSDQEIVRSVESGDIGLTPFREEQVNPSSYDLTLSPYIRVAWPSSSEIDVANVEEGYTYAHKMSSDGFVLGPGACVLASTVERIRLNNGLASRVEGKSSLGRLFLAVHITAGFFDPGWDGECTLEIVNHLPRPIRLRPGMRIAQMAFFRMSHYAKVPYAAKGHYQGQQGPTESKGVGIVTPSDCFASGV